MNKMQFKSRKEVTEFLKTKGIDTSNWSEEKWLSINKGQAEIHMMALAESMYDAYNDSKPELKLPGEWHIPFGDKIKFPIGDLKQLNPEGIKVTELAVKVATAMAARTSYTVIGAKEKAPNYEADIQLHDVLLASKHMSPFEHCARVPRGDQTFEEGMTHMDHNGQRWSGNFKGWIQYRQIIEQRIE